MACENVKTVKTFNESGLVLPVFKMSSTVS